MSQRHNSNINYLPEVQALYDTADFELNLAQKLLDRPDLNVEFTVGKNQTTQLMFGTNKIKLSLQDDPIILHHIVRTFICHIVSETLDQEKYRWQRNALKLGLIQNITATDMCECKYCGSLTVFTRTKLCATCKQVKDSVELHPALARRILKDVEAALADMRENNNSSATD